MVTEFLEAGWKAYKRSFWPIIGATLIVAVISMLLNIGFFGTFLAAPFAAAAATGDMASIEAAFAGIIAPMAIFGVIFAIIFIELSGGLTGVYAESLKRKAQVGTLFSTIQRLWLPILGVAVVIVLSFLAVLAIAMALAFVHPVLGFVAGAVGFLALPFRLLLAEAAVVVSGYPVRKALSTSWKVVGKNYLSFLGLVLLLFVILLIVGFIPIVGAFISFLVVAPVGGIAIVQFYIKNLKKR